MSDEYKTKEGQIKRMLLRKERITRVMGELKQIVTEVDTDITSLQLQLDALRFEGDSATKGDEDA